MTEMQIFPRFLREVAYFLEEEIKMETLIESLVCMVGLRTGSQRCCMQFVGRLVDNCLLSSQTKLWG